MTEEEVAAAAAIALGLGDDDSGKKNHCLYLDAKGLTRGRRIGTGGEGSVYEGRYKDTPVAVKCSHLMQTEDVALDEAIKTIEEARMLSQLHHMNVLRFYGTCVRWRGVGD